MKLSEKIIRVLLIFLIGLSLFLTYSIWLSPASKTPNVNSSTTKKVANNEQNFTKATEAFLPIRGIWDRNGESYQTNSENLLATAQARLTESTYGQLQLVAEGESHFQDYLRLNDGLELNYEGAFSLTEYVKVFDLPLNLKNIKDSDAIIFSKIQVDFGKQKIRFLSYRKHQVYEASILTKETSLDQLYTKNPHRFIPMTVNNQLIPRLMQTKDSVKLKKYSYILSTQPYSLFRNAFFQEPDKVKGEEGANGVRSFVSGHEDMEMDEQKRIVKFSGELPERLKNGSIYTQSFNYVSRLGTVVGNLKYFDRKDDRLTYRIFVEGYPIFSQAGKGQLKITIGDTKNELANQVAIETSMDTIQVPVPSDEIIELPSSLTMLNKLQASGIDLSTIQSYIIGYTWQDVEGVNKVVSLTPEWYVKYNDSWYTMDQMLSGDLHSGSEAN